MVITDKPQNAKVALRKVNRGLEERQTVGQAKAFGLGYVNISKIPINPDVLKIIPKEQALDTKCFGFFQVGKKLRVGMVDPDRSSTISLLESLKEKGYKLNLNLISQSSFEDGILEYANVKYAPAKIVENVIDEDVEVGIVKKFDDFDDKKTFEIVNEIFVKALSYDASDIHLEPLDKTGEIRFRIDGVMTVVSEMPIDLFHEVIMQVKHLAKLKLNVTSRPQDGRTFFIVNKEQIDVRVSSLPCQHGEDVVMRILDSRTQKVHIEDLGLEGRAKDDLNRSLQSPTGLVLVTGPTGSGKTTTLYSILEHMHTGKRKIITLEDPIEYRMSGITQSQINEHENYTFNSGLRSILRQDPDIIMVGEIRDKETAEVASQASLTGHKVLSTLHTNSSVATISRLINMGLEPFMIAPSLDLIVSQRLVRRLCKKCVKQVPVTSEMKSYLQQYLPSINKKTGQVWSIPEILPQIQGCEFCNQTGYKGRLGLYEMLSVDDQVRQYILKGASESQIRDYVYAEGMLNLFEYGVIKVIEGITTVEEVYRVTSE